MLITFKPYPLLCAALFLVCVLRLAPAQADGRPFIPIFVEPAADGYQLKAQDQVKPWDPPVLPQGQEWNVEIVATRLYVGDLPDLARKHDVIFKVTASTDTTRRKRLGNNGAIAYSRKFEMRSDSAAGYSATRLLSGVPVDQTMDLEIGLFELDGAAKRKYNSLTPLFLLIEDTPSGESIFSAPAGNAYVKLAMAAFNLVYNDMAKNDTILLNEFGMHIKPAVGILPIRPGQWIFLEEARKKDYRIEDPLQDLTFDGRRLSFAEGISDKKMPTYIILSINITPAPITAN